MGKRYIGLLGLLLLPLSAFATELIQMPGDWLDRIATSSIPLANALWTPILFLVGLGVVGWLIGKLTGH